MHLIRDVLDSQLKDKTRQPMGTVDGLVAELRDDQPPRLAIIESGFPVLARRVHPAIEKMVRWLGRRFGMRRGRVLRISWRKVTDVGIDVELSIDAEATEALAWERWAKETIVDHIPGSG